MTKKEKDIIVEEFRDLGGAFVEDNVEEDEMGNEIYSPHVDRETAAEWLNDKLKDD